MDTITAFALSINDPLLRLLEIAIDNTFVYACLIIGLLLIGEKRDDKRIKVMISIALAALLAYGVKYSLAVERPCSGDIWCPDGFSFPSMHATVAFALATGFLNKKRYWLFLLFALFVSFTRLNLGVHMFVDIAGALPIALVSYYLTDLFYKEGKNGP
jgi:membrane-associated phospholipid phosphatase